MHTLQTINQIMPAPLLGVVYGCAGQKLFIHGMFLSEKPMPSNS